MLGGCRCSHRAVLEKLPLRSAFRGKAPIAGGGKLLSADGLAAKEGAAMGDSAAGAESTSGASLPGQQPQSLLDITMMGLTTDDDGW